MKKGIIILIVTIFVACKQKESVSTAEVEIIDANTELTESASNLFEQIKVVDLETTDASLVGLFISHIEIWDGKIFILNELQSHNNILCFDLSGKFLFKIDRMGQGPEEYTYLGDFFIDKHRNHLVTLNSPEVKHWDSEGNFLYSVKADDMYYARRIIYQNDSTYLAFNDGGVATVVPEGTTLLHLDPVTMNVRNKSDYINECSFNSGNRFSIYNERILCRSYNDSIYDVSDINNVHAVYFIDYKEQAKLKEQLWRDLKVVTDYRERNYLLSTFFKSNFFSGKIKYIKSIHENDKYFVLSTSKVIEGANINDAKTSDNHIYFYDKNTKKTYDSENIDFGGVKLHDCAIMGGNESLYCIVYSDFTEEAKAKIKNSPVFSEEDKQKLIAFKADEDNPLIIVLK
jgi:hypothetical protein